MARTEPVVTLGGMGTQATRPITSGPAGAGCSGTPNPGRSDHGVQSARLLGITSTRNPVGSQRVLEPQSYGLQVWRGLACGDPCYVLAGSAQRVSHSTCACSGLIIGSRFLQCRQLVLGSSDPGLSNRPPAGRLLGCAGLQLGNERSREPHHFLRDAGQLRAPCAAPTGTDQQDDRHGGDDGNAEQPPRPRSIGA